MKKIMTKAQWKAEVEYLMSVREQGDAAPEMADGWHDFRNYLVSVCKMAYSDGESLIANDIAEMVKHLEWEHEVA
jgi:hypothetical protein